MIILDGDQFTPLHNFHGNCCFQSVTKLAAKIFDEIIKRLHILREDVELNKEKADGTIFVPFTIPGHSRKRQVPIYRDSSSTSERKPTFDTLAV